MSRTIEIPSKQRPGHSTGPRTPEGKARSSQNALKDGFRSAAMIVPKGMEEENAAFVERYRQAFTPETEAEAIVFDMMVRDAWKLHRIERKLAALAADGLDPLDDPACQKEYDRLERLHDRAGSSFRSNMRQLGKLQSNRVSQALLPDPLGEGTVPALVKPSDIVQLAKRTHSNWPAMAVNTFATRANRLREARERKPRHTPISHKDFLR